MYLFYANAFARVVLASVANARLLNITILLCKALSYDMHIQANLPQADVSIAI